MFMATFALFVILLVIVGLWLQYSPGNILFGD